MTNYEKIKNMSVEEMAIFLYSYIADCEMCPAVESCKASRELTCKERLFEWLESEVEENMLPEICSCGYRFVADETTCPNCGKKVEENG